MKKLFYLSVIFMLTLALSSLSSNDNQNDDASMLEGGSTSCISRFARSSSCDGCHSGTNNSGPVIIIYSDGKTSPFNLPVEQGSNQVIVYNETKNAISMDEIMEFLATNKVSVNAIDDAVVEDNSHFNDVHGIYSQEILNHLMSVSLHSDSKQNIVVKSNTNLNLSASQSSQDIISASIQTNSPQSGVLSLFDMNGKLIQSQNISLEKGINEFSFHLNEMLNTGFYLIQIKSGVDVVSKKLVIQ